MAYPIVPFRVFLFQVLLAYPFVPFVWFMGVDDEDIHIVATLLGLKVIANEFLAYYLLGVSIRTAAISVSNHGNSAYYLLGMFIRTAAISVSNHGNS